MDFSDQATLLIPLKAKDTGNVFFMWRAYAKRFAKLVRAMTKNESNGKGKEEADAPVIIKEEVKYFKDAIPVEIEEQGLRILLQYLDDMVSTTKMASLPELIALVKAAQYLELGNESSSFEGFQIMSDLIFQGEIGLATWDEFNRYAKENGRTLSSMTDTLWILESINDNYNVMFSIRTRKPRLFHV